MNKAEIIEYITNHKLFYKCGEDLDEKIILYNSRARQINRAIILKIQELIPDLDPAAKKLVLAEASETS